MTRPHLHPLFWPMLAGLVLRVVAALWGYGYFAADDVKYAIEPAWRWLEDPHAPHPSDIRSPLFARGIWLTFELGRLFGLDSPVALLRFAYLCLGLYSLTAIPATHALARDTVGHRGARIAAWLVAAHALMPRFSTLALISVAALPPVTAGMALVVRADRDRSALYAFFGAYLLALASMLRFQAGLLFIAVLLATLLHLWRGAGPTLGLLAGGLLGAFTQGLWDLNTRGEWFGSLFAYVSYNLESSSSFGRAPWFTYILFFLLLTVPPLTYWLARPLWNAARQAPWVSGPLLFFVVVHSAIPHKEERFIFTVLPLFFVLLGEALRSVPRRVARAFWGLNLLFLLVATTSDGNRAVAAPLREVGERSDIAAVVTIGKFYAPRFYTDGRATVRQTRNLAAALDERARGTTRFIFQRIPTPHQMQLLRDAGYRCGAPRAYPGDAIDRLLLLLNPEGNKRRRPRHVLDCTHDGTLR